MQIAIDTGGTFTDCVYFDGGKLRVLKVFSTPSDPGQAVLDALRSIDAQGQLNVRHGTTVGTNAMLERKGARVAFVTTAGFEETIAIGRQARARLYDWFQPAPDCLVPTDLRFGVEERISAEGALLEAPDALFLARLAERIRASRAEAVSLLFAFANPVNERAVSEALQKIGVPVSISHRILPEFREYERASTIVANAYLSRVVSASRRQRQCGLCNHLFGLLLRSALPAGSGCSGNRRADVSGRGACPAGIRCECRTTCRRSRRKCGNLAASVLSMCC